MESVEPALHLYLQGLADAVAWQKPMALIAQYETNL